MKDFMCKDFLLSTETAKKLYHDFASQMPIIDYHCHIKPQEIAENKTFENITQLWLGGDHYKWRLMRANGIEEHYITGDATDREKFQKWAETLEMAIGNPLYHWSYAELREYIGFNGYLNGETAQEVWDLAIEKLNADDSLSARGIIKSSNVELICTTDDPIDSLEWHEVIANDTTFDTKVLPAWRPEKAMDIKNVTYLDYIKNLETVSNTKIHSFADLINALKIRLDFFASMGCIVSDHTFDFIMCEDYTADEIEAIFAKRLENTPITELEVLKFNTAFMFEMAKEYSHRDWAMQLHFGSLRNNNTKMLNTIGSNTGFDAISNYAPASKTADFLDLLSMNDILPRTILYSLNPNDNSYITSIISCFQDSSAASKIQHGSAWWFNDHKQGMTSHMENLANFGMLSNFIGMLTDSRSFMSYARHEYFRRILCEFVGNLVENGEYPQNYKALEKIIKGISYENTKKYFKF